MTSQTEYGTYSVIDRADERRWQLSGPVCEPDAIDQFQTERDSDGCLRQTRDCRIEQHVAGESRPIEVRRQRDHVGLPDVDGDHVRRRHHDARPALVELDPVHPAAGHHGAERSIRSPAAAASRRVGRSLPASAASANNWWEKGTADAAAWRRSCSVTHRENGTSRPSMIGITSSGTLIVLLGTYV